VNVLFQNKQQETEVEKRHHLELTGSGHGLLSGLGFKSPPKTARSSLSLAQATDELITAVSNNVSARSSFCYALNNQRSVNTCVSGQTYVEQAGGRRRGDNSFTYPPLPPLPPSPLLRSRAQV
jgi:hypothetical protein